MDFYRLEVDIKAVDGFDGKYYVTRYGEVLSVPRPKTKGGLLKQHLTQNGYAFVCLYNGKKKKSFRIHTLVAEHFIGKRPDGLVIHHKDGNKLNNNVRNLEYVSMQRNTQEYYKSIGKCRGEILIREIPSIIKRVSLGEKTIDIANEYGVTRNDIGVICKVIKLTGEELTLK